MRRLLVDFARIGDLVMMVPALRLLAQDAELHLVSRPWARPLLGAQPFLAGIHTLVHPNHGPWSEWLRGRPREVLGRQLAAIGFDEVVLIEGERELITGWLDRHLPGVPRRSFHHGTVPGYVADGAGEGLAAAGFDVTRYVPVPRLEIDPTARERMRARLAPLGKRVVLIQAGTSLTHRRWRPRPNLKSLAPAQWAELMTRLLQAPAETEARADAVVLLGSALEAADAQALVALLPPALQSRVRVWADISLADLPALSAEAQGMISADTGPAHIAAAAGCPLLVLFGPSDPKRWAPRGEQPVEIVVGEAPCGPCMDTPRFKTCRANVCLTGLPVPTIMAGWVRLMGRRRASGV